MPQIDTLKPLATLFAALLFAVGLGGAAPVQAQDGSSPVLSVPSVEAEAGSGVDVPVEATDFNNVGAASLTITYDPSVVSFANGADTESPISGAPDGFQANVVEPGELRVNFFDQTGENPINFGTGTLFTVNFGSFEGGTSPVAFGADSQVNDPNRNALGTTFEDGAVSGQVGAVTAGTVEGAGLNQTVSVPLSADSIGNVGAASFEVEFDESVLAFEGVSGDESGLALQGDAEGGVVSIGGTDTDGATLEGEFVDLEFRFLGGSSEVTFAGGSEIVDATSSSTEIATNFSGGEVAGDSPTVSLPSASGVPGDTLTVPVETSELQDVGSASIVVTFDGNALSFAGSEESLEGFQVGSPESGVVNVSGTSTEGADPSANGDRFTDLQFTVESGLDPGETTPVGFDRAASEITNPDAERTLAYNTAFEDGQVQSTQTVPTLSVPSVEAEAGSGVDVPVEATDFNNVGAASLTITYDPSVVSFANGADTESPISGAPDGFQANVVEPGELRVNFFDQTGENPINFGTGTLFTVNFGSFEGGTSPVAFGADSQVNDPNRNALGTTFEDGAVSGQVGAVTAGTVEGAGLNQTVSVPLSADSIGNVGAASFEVEFDESVLAFEGVSGDESGLALQGDAEGGVVSIGGTDTDGATLEGEFVDLEFRFLGGSSEVTFAGGSEIVDATSSSTEIATNFSGGEVAGDSPTLSFPDRGVTAGDTISVPVQTTELQAIGSASVVVDFNPASLTFVGSEESLEGFQVGSPESGVVNVSGTSTDGVDPSANESKITSLLFEVGSGFGEGSQTTLGFDAGASELTNPGVERTLPYNVSFEEGRLVGEQAQIAVSPESVTYDVTAIDSTNGRVVTISNEASEAARLSGESVLPGDSAPFTIASGGGSFELGPGESRDITVEYAPTEASNPDRDTLEISHNAENTDSPIEVALEGTAEAPSIAASVAPDTAAVRSGEELALTQTVTNEAADAAVLEVEVTGIPDFLSLEGASVTGGEGAVDGQALTLQPGAEAELEYSFQESVDTTTVFGGSIVHQTNDPDAASPLELPVEITVDPVQVALNAQALDLTAGDTELRVEEVTANAGDAVVITTADDDGDGEFGDEEIAGSAPVEENLDGGEVLVDVEGASPIDHVAHVSTDGTVPGVVATSDRAPVYAVDQFDWQDETSVGPAGTVTVDVVKILYEGSVGQDTISINLHEASGGEITGEFVGISQEDLAVNETHEEVAVDVIEPISPPAESPQRTESTIAETGEFFAMAHLGPAGTGADGGRVPVGGAQQPPLRTTASPGVIGDFATVTVEAADLNVSVSRDFEGGASDPTDYELVAIPGSTGVDVAETVTGDRGTNWRAFLETGGSDGSLQSYGDEPFSFRAGRGVWVLAQNGWSFEGTVPAVSAADGTPSVPLQDGWNAISNPLQEDLVWANVRDASGLSEALFRWTGEDRFQRVDTLRSAQENGEAYYTLNNEGADSLELTSSAGPNSTLAANTAAESRSNASPRTVELSATADGKSMTSTVTVGMNPSAEEASSYRAPPAHFGGTALRIRDGDPVKSFMRMVAATDAETSRFDLSLQAEPGTSVEISAGDLPKNAGPGFGVVLVDGGDTYDLRDGPATVTVSENGGSAGFQVRLGDAEEIAQQTAPDKTRLRANYPNPFSEQTTIEYDLAEQSEVNIRVYNVLGQQVATLAQGRKQAGTYKIDWSGQSLSSGKYFVRLEAGGTTDTKQVTVVR
ncbi:cohesin domain-containing protein [Salinibacter ruber]|uniref:cohesin domain-containing protein n=1 Tax=Salinibacter ruber TaxID=146919 RepID=UPI002168F8EB|nr:cohesin domain-containing protein [Salinibacter ruber]MCS3612969.1 hypothetical protein [Salinibacter ruber]MCS3675700.1 hypothetical protein [Salinibacter ruber]